MITSTKKNIPPIQAFCVKQYTSRENEKDNHVHTSKNTVIIAAYITNHILTVNNSTVNRQHAISTG